MIATTDGKFTLYKLLGLIPVVPLIAACNLGPNFVRPSPQVPAHWSNRAMAPPAAAGQAPPAEVTEQSAELRGWWSGLGDPTLSALIDRAAGSNLDLRAAVL